MNRRQILILAVVIAGIAYVEWLVVPVPSTPASAPATEEPWEIRGQVQYNPSQAAAELNTTGLWGKLADTPSQTAADEEWHFLGTMARGAERHVIVKVGNQPEKRLAPGDSLPDGSKILGIESDRICLLINNKKRYLPIYAQGLLSGKMSSGTP